MSADPLPDLRVRTSAARWARSLAAGVAAALIDLALGLLRAEPAGLRALDLVDPLALGTLAGALLHAGAARLLERGRERGAAERGAAWGLGALVLALDAAGGSADLEGLALVALVAGACALLAARALGPRASRPRGLAALVVAGALVLALPLGARAAARVRGRVAPPATTQAPIVPRVILIVLDTLRYDALSCLAPGAPPTPQLDALAARSHVYTQAWAPAPWTLPSVASIMTGVSPLVHRATSPRAQLPRELETLAERFAAAGYATAALGQNPFLAPRSGLARGFGRYEMRPTPSTELRCASGALLRTLRGPRGLELPAARLTDAALAFAREHEGQPFFLWLHYYDAHLPYAPPPEFAPAGPPPRTLGPEFGGLVEVRTGAFAPTPDQRRWIRALYDGEVRLLDREVGRLLGGLEARGLLDGALVVLTSDHGEEHWEHGGFEHGHAFHEELLRVPLFVKLPGQRAPRVLEQPVSLVALAPTLSTLCGLGLDPRRLGAASLFDAAGEPAPAAEPALVAAGNLYFAPRFALRAGPTKYVHGVTDGEEALFDLARDPLERARLEAREPERLEAARRALDEAVAAAEALRARLGLGAAPTAAWSRRELELLRASGYLDAER